jgi:calcium-binding protein CML
MVKIKMPALFRRRSGSKSPPLPQADPASGGGSPAPTPEEEMERVFRKFDANGDGRISRSELGALFESLGHAATDDELARMMAEADADGDGFISLDEFAALNATASGDAAAVVTVGADAKIFFALLFQSDLWREGILGGRIGDIAVAEGDFGR